MRNYVKFSDIKCERQPLLFSNPNPEIEHNFPSDVSHPKSLDSLQSYTVSCCKGSSHERLCRICHCPSSLNDNLISPCRCSGSLKYVHMSCLLHWLTICSRKLKRPAICELCLYRYHRRRLFKVLFTFFLTLIQIIYSNQFVSKDWQSILSSTTLTAAIIFFLGLFVAMYIHFKIDISLIGYLIQCWRNNHDWIIEEYCPTQDLRYSLKLKQIRRKINGICLF
ncbi:unnamed protein product [Dracunculus medinensis]|uniref:RING-CH-type domain-containing protein n=1 Tax=Dracunculus medinensis TaxID=318479 RepID=A0A158Q2V3_DRAME|nr:unnamed protein product [Dracunculus medinensis]